MKNKKPKPLITESFTNDFGTVNVGDSVIVVTTGFNHRVNVNKGKYIGYVESHGLNGKVVKKVKIQVNSYRDAWFWKGSPTEWKWNWLKYDLVKDQVEYRKVPYVRTMTLQLNRIAPIKEQEFNTVETVSKLV